MRRTMNLIVAMMNCVVVFYETFTTSYSYSPIGHITTPEGLKEALGSGKVTIIFE